MPRRRDPILAVLDFFGTQPLPAAELALSLAKEEVRRRQKAEGGLSPRGQAVSAKHKGRGSPAKAATDGTVERHPSPAAASAGVDG